MPEISVLSLNQQTSEKRGKCTVSLGKGKVPVVLVAQDELLFTFLERYVLDMEIL